MGRSRNYRCETRGDKFIYGTGTPLQMAQLMTIQGPITVAKTQYTYDA